MKLCNRCTWLGKQKKTHSYICYKRNSKFKAPFPHGKTRKACSLYESRFPSAIPQIVPQGMRLIEELRGKEEFKDSDFWIIGTGPNLDYYADDFFDDKFSIAVNLSCFAFPGSTFFCMTGREELKRMISNYPDCLRRMILPLEHIISGKGRRIGYWEDWGLEPIYMRPEDQSMTSSVPDYKSTVKRILSDGPCNFVLVRTVVHLAIFAAAVLGAKTIILVGCSHAASKGRIYARKRGMGNFISEHIRSEQIYPYYSAQDGGIVRLRRDTIQLAKAFEEYGIKVMRHRYNKDTSKFAFEEIKDD